ncbi:MAG: hypothetical protein HBSAPP04_08220 [Ignavibacteriaceae bacterium]|nr:MAG: hypothetical protein HBSAPP04_08220 [Ignavibacteriaceae bacterium]
MKRFFLIIILSVTTLFGQYDPIPFYPSNDTLNHQSGEIVAVTGTQFYSLMPVITGKGSIRYTFHKSSNAGTTWWFTNTVFDTTLTSLVMEDSLATPFLLRVNNNRLIAIFKVGSGAYRYKWSEDDGVNWSASLKLTLWANPAIEPTMKITSAVYTGGNEIVLGISQNQNSTGFSRSTDNGATFSTYQILSTGGISNPALLSTGNGDMLMAVQEKNLNNTKLLLIRYSSSSGQWHDTTVALSGTDIIRNPKLYRQANGIIHLIYKKIRYTIGGYRNSDLYRISSTNSGVTWTAPTQLTRFMGEDTNPNINPQSVIPLVIFSSYRQMPNGKIHLWWGNCTTLYDDDAPPVIYSARMIPTVPVEGDSVSISVYAGYHKPGLTGKIEGTLNSQPVQYPLYDDGLHNDSLAGDGIFRGFIKVAAKGDFAQLHAAIQGGNNFLSSQTFSWSILLDGVWPETAFYTGRIWVPFGRNGVIADATVNGRSGLFFDSISTIFSNGFALTALKDGAVWGAANMSASRIDDFLPGPVGASLQDPRLGIYRVAQADSAFGSSWQTWKYAVELGARFWDGNHNGIYDPIDLNNNGIWEPNEDMPEILGEISYWCIYNDGVPKELRRYPIDPTGIEVRQTIYAFPNSSSQEVRNAVFIRYEIVNKGTVVQILPEAYYSMWSDTDMGEYTDDLYGTDTLRNSMYFYNEGSDGSFGVNPPSVFHTILFGQPVFVPGVSFTDVNNNGVYDPGVDIPLDTARVPMGEPFTEKLLPGAMNFGSTSTQHYLSAHPTHGDPQTVNELRSYQQGRQKNGLIIDPCTWPYGQVYSDSCARIPGRFLYSGDPVTHKGWLTNTPTDQRGMVNAGPFNLNAGDSITFHTAIVIGRGTNELNSITVTRAAIDTIFSRFGAKHHFYPTGVKEVAGVLPDEYRLYQNYPNPFNPETEVRFAIRERSKVTMTVYDILGGKVADILVSELERGEYRHTFNGKGLSSGVYFIRFEARSVTTGVEFTKTIKAVLLQ